MNVNGVGNELGEFAADDLPELGELKIDSPSAQSAVEPNPTTVSTLSNNAKANGGPPGDVLSKQASATGGSLNTIKSPSRSFLHYQRYTICYRIQTLEGRTASVDRFPSAAAPTIEVAEAFTKEPTRQDTTEDDSNGKITYVLCKVDPKLGNWVEPPGVSPIKRKEELAITPFFTAKEISRYDGSKDGPDIIIKRPELKELLYSILKDWIEHSGRWQWVEDEVTLKAKFVPLVHYWEELQAASRGEAVDVKSWGPPKPAGSSAPQLRASTETLKYLRKLLEHVAALVPETIRCRETYRQSKMTTYDDLWTLFKAGTFVIATPYMEFPQLFQVYGRGLSYRNDNTYAIECWAYYWDGKNLKRKVYEFSIEVYEHERRMKDLSCYPVEFYEGPNGEDMEAIRLNLMARGKKFQKLCVGRKRSLKMFKYEGVTLTQNPTVVGKAYHDNAPLNWWEPLSREVKIDASEVMVDADSYLRFGPGILCLGDKVPILIKGSCDCELCLSSDRKKWSEKFVNYEMREDDFDYLLLPAKVLGYALNRKIWAQFTIDEVADVDNASPNEVYNNQLVFPGNDSEDQKVDLKSLVVDHIKVREREASSHKLVNDPIRGKGKGLILLFHGPIGVGKTLAAESLARCSQKPLFKVGVSDIGLDPAKAELKLVEPFFLAEAWDAILLIDEADVFLNARGTKGAGDPQKNALVSVLLREVEYFKGVLIMTTNRAIAFDIAMLSRIHRTINFGTLTAEQESKVWNIYYNKLVKSQSHSADLGSIETWIKRHRKKRTGFNGREIRNVFITTKTLASEIEGRVTFNHIERSYDPVKAFKKQMNNRVVANQSLTVVEP